jgi:cell division septation protein DedD
MITRHLADLLHYHECVIVPGLGGFIKAYSPARILHYTHEFSPPSASVAFNGGLSGNDGQLANYIAAVENISYNDALSDIRHWSEISNASLKNGDKVVLDGIGELFMNASAKIEFTPTRQINFNTDSFGLPVFFAKVVDESLFVLPEIQPVKHVYKGAKLQRLIPETLKWAAVLAPFIAFGLWSSLNGNIIDNYIHNYTGMYSWVRSTPGKTATVNATPAALNAKETPVEPAQSPAGILAKQNIPFDPAAISYTELAKNNIVITDPVKTETEKTLDQGENYYIIGGAFRDHSNALKLISMLQEQGYPAAVVDTTPGGLYIVSMKGFNKYDEANTELDEIKKAGFSSSWILKKNKGQG